MLSFATEFPVKETTPENFIAAVKEWILGSPHTKFSAQQVSTLPASGRWKIEAANSSLEALLVQKDDGHVVGFRHVSQDRDLEWITEVVYSKSSEDDWVSIRTSRESEHPQPTLPPAKKPLLVRTLIEKLGGGLDDELYVSDEPHYLRDQDVRMAVRLLNGDAENYLPLVYISSPFSGGASIDPNPLARSLGGLAHVLVEPSRSFSRSIQRDVGSQNVYGGAIGVYWPNGEHYRYLTDRDGLSEFDIRQDLVANIRRALLHRRPLPRCTWSRAEAAAARMVFEQLRTSGSNDVEEYVAAFDAELADRSKQLQAAEQEISRLNAKLRSKGDQGTDGLFSLSFADEQEFFSGEFAEILKDGLLTASNNAQDGGRRKHVLSAAASSISSGDTLRVKRAALKDLLSRYKSMDGALRNRLEAAGFDISDDGKHVKLLYMSDDRYTFTLPKSGSDWRGGMNSVSDISKRIF